jgi:hypothetical protein
MLKLSGREEGSYSDSQVTQMFADGRVNRYTPCRAITDKDWKAVDDYLPTLKYGTQLPAPTAPPIPVAVSAVADGQRIALVDIGIPFISILKMMFKVTGAALIVWCCLIPVFIAVWVIVMTLFASLIGGALSGVNHP